MPDFYAEDAHLDAQYEERYELDNTEEILDYDIWDDEDQWDYEDEMTFEAAREQGVTFMDDPTLED
jgi:hypothetical protein